MAETTPEMRETPTIDVVIAVHDASRPVTRAIASVLHDGVDGVRVIVVCHGVSADAFDRTAFADEAVDWREYSDGIRSPAGPFDHGLSVATADYVAIMGSDDFLEHGAVAAASARLGADAPDALVLPLRHQSGEAVRTPLARRGRVRRLDPVRDRLAYRTAPLALLRRRLIDELELSLTPGLASGEDIDFSSRLWFSGARVDFHPADPAYVIGADAATRVTAAPMPAATELEAVRMLLASEWIRGLTVPKARSLVIKLIRIHILGPILRRAESDELSPSDVEAYSEVARAAVALAPGAVRPFARVDRDLVDVLASGSASAAAVLDIARVRPAAGRFARLVPRNIFATLDREGAVRRFLRYRTWP
ncbi:glycosyltransferase [Agromyces endophyticus]|uniref:glycosyltransferase n=1 Tax=Agromyces sp. H17E-10 TaxID=2932244 RepID=UPI001FD41BC0|nr:glycosyltransferase [Agromyces sp. H17E-10]UOQ89834.1 glycosyltransferase [Agromyces sp. H17E-10]